MVMSSARSEVTTKSEIAQIAGLTQFCFSRIFVGLPPGPVGSPGESSIDAALNPAQTDYLYYVREPSRDDGAHNFYSKEADFEKGVRALREWERTRGTGR